MTSMNCWVDFGGPCHSLSLMYIVLYVLLFVLLFVVVLWFYKSDLYKPRHIFPPLVKMTLDPPDNCSLIWFVISVLIKLSLLPHLSGTSVCHIDKSGEYHSGAGEKDSGRGRRWQLRLIPGLLLRGRRYLWGDGPGKNKLCEVDKYTTIHLIQCI